MEAKACAKKNTFPIMDIDFMNTTKDELLQGYLYPGICRDDKNFVVTANPEIIMKTREDASYRRAVQQADFVVPDGAGIILASKFLGQPLRERIPGFDLMESLLKYADAEGLSCYFLGADETVLEKMLENIRKDYPNIVISGSHHGYFNGDGDAIAWEVQQKSPDIVFVALGFPKQEKWITTHLGKFHKGLFMGVGGSFDVIAGNVKRAPDRWIRLNLEWLYRLLKQPFRWKRTLKALKFILLVLFRRK